MKNKTYDLYVMSVKTHKPLCIMTLAASDFSAVIPLYWSDMKTKIAYDKLIALYPKLKGLVYIKAIEKTTGALYGV